MKIMKRNSPPVNDNVDINKSSQAEPKMNAERAE
jgi:hypothetical protein